MLRWGLLGAGVVVAAVAAVVAFVVFGGGAGESSPQASQPPPQAASTGELSVLRTPDYHSMAISPVDPNIILYGHHGGVLRSTDGGRSWEKTNLTGSTDDAMGMGISPADANTVYAAGHNTFFESLDGGKTWESLKPNLPRLDVHGLAAAPGRLYANVVGVGLFRGDENGESWTLASKSAFPSDVMTLSASGTDTVYVASMGSGVLRSDDGGATFRPTGKLNAGVLSVAAYPGDVNIVYAGTDKGVFASTDGGKTWVPRSVPGGGEALVMAVSPTDPKDIVVVMVRPDRAGHVYRSRDGGETWGGS